MKKYFLLAITVLHVSTVFTQSVSPKSIEDSVIGWMKVYNFKGIFQPMKVDDKTYSAAQLAICDSFANWMQASYLPKGGLGNVKKGVSEKLGLYNQHTAGKPQSYGAYSRTYTDLKYNSKGKLEPASNLHVFWNVFANQVPGDWPVRDICTPGQYYFTIPSFEASEEGEEASKNKYDLSEIENLSRYTKLWVKNMGWGGGKETVILSKDNKSPFIEISKAEYLGALEMAIPRFYDAERKRIYEAEQGVQQRMATPLKQLEEKIEGFTNGLKKNREKYKDRLGEPATVGLQPGLMDLTNGRDVFSGQYLTDPETNSKRYAVFKVDPAVAELCKKDTPQWILISWEYNAVDPIEKHQHASIINNFKFEYVYNFFFDPVKVKGLPYKPLRTPYYKTR